LALVAAAGGAQKGPPITMSTMKDRRGPREGVEPGERHPPPEVVDRLAGLLPEGALDDAVRGLKPEELSGPGGLLSQLAGRVVEAALEAELTEHLGHPPGGRPQGPNVRNGATSKTVQTDLGPVEIKTPRDRDGSFEPRLVAKRQTRLAGLDDKVLGLYAGGMTVRDIAAHLSELYGTEIGRDTVSRITDAVLEDVAAWRTRPLEAVYPIVYFDAMMVRVREDRSVQNRACYLALGVTCDGEREVLGIWWQDSEGAKFWLAVLNDLRRRGVADVLIACVDGLKGFPEAIEATFPRAWVQTCIVHLIRASLRYVNYRDKKKIATALRPIYTAPNADQALAELDRFDAEWGTRYPAAVQVWRTSWEHVIPFLSLPDDLRRAVYTTNTIEGLHRQVRKAIKTRGHFPDEQAATKLIYLALIRADAKWQRNRAWTAARAALKIHFGDRYPG
jgi:putative transposase